MEHKQIIAFACISMLLLLTVQGIASNATTQKISLRAPAYNPNTPPKTFEDLFFPHWFENGTYTFSVPEYMHHFYLASTLWWAKYYQYGTEYGRPAFLKIYDNDGIVYWKDNNSQYDQPIGAPGNYSGAIKGTKLIISIKGKALIQFGIWGSWFENIIDGGKYNVTFPGSKIALYMDYYNPTNKHTFYFKASEPVYAYLFDASGNLIDHTEKAVKSGSVTEPYDATPFLTFVKPEGEKGNVTVQFWMNYEQKKVDYTGVGLMAGIFLLIAVVAYFYAKRSVYGKGRRKR